MPLRLMVFDEPLKRSYFLDLGPFCIIGHQSASFEGKAHLTPPWVHMGRGWCMFLPVARALTGQAGAGAWTVKSCCCVDTPM